MSSLWSRLCHVTGVPVPFSWLASTSIITHGIAQSCPTRENPRHVLLKEWSQCVSVTLSPYAFRYFTTPWVRYYSLALTETGRASTAPTEEWQAVKCVSWQLCAPLSSSPPLLPTHRQVSPTGTVCMCNVIRVEKALLVLDLYYCSTACVVLPHFKALKKHM